jgi:hypothetical protein
VGQKVLSKPSADSFAVGRRQKVKRKFINQAYLSFSVIRMSIAAATPRTSRAKGNMRLL